LLNGLKCNFAKTVIARIGEKHSQPDPPIECLGFTLDEDCELLGFTINGRTNSYNKQNAKYLEDM
jgi:hypothetical protein